jgi:hypothetical protein
MPRFLGCVKSLWQTFWHHWLKVALVISGLGIGVLGDACHKAYQSLVFWTHKTQEGENKKIKGQKALLALLKAQDSRDQLQRARKNPLSLKGFIALLHRAASQASLTTLSLSFEADHKGLVSLSFTSPDEDKAHLFLIHLWQLTRFHLTPLSLTLRLISEEGSVQGMYVLRLLNPLTPKAVFPGEKTSGHHTRAHHQHNQGGQGIDLGVRPHPNAGKNDHGQGGGARPRRKAGNHQIIHGKRKSQKPARQQRGRNNGQGHKKEHTVRPRAQIKGRLL